MLLTAGEAASGRNRQLATVHAAAARDSMQAIPGIGEAMLGPPPGTGDPFTQPSGLLSRCHVVCNPQDCFQHAILCATFVTYKH